MLHIPEIKMTKLSGKQTMIVTIIIILIIGFPNAYGVWSNTISNNISENNQLVMISSLKDITKILSKEHVNELGFPESCEVFEKTFNTFKCDITRLIMTILHTNHIDDLGRQKYIREAVTNSIKVTYKKSWATLSKFKFNGHFLNEPMVTMNEGDISEKLLEYMFSHAGSDKELLTKDLLSMLDTIFDSYISDSQAYLYIINQEYN